MIDWVLFIGYVIGFFVVGRIMYVLLDKHDPDEWDPLYASVAGFFWPVIALGMLSYGVFKLTIGRETPRQRRERLDRELYDTEQLAHQHGLPYPAPTDAGLTPSQQIKLARAGYEVSILPDIARLRSDVARLRRETEQLIREQDAR